jgi:hypothetical protein
MSTWLYQLNGLNWSPEIFRYEIWEGKSWHWEYGKKRGDVEIKTGDTLIFYYTPSGCKEPGIYGWAVLERCDEKSQTLYFVPAAPTDRLKKDPWWNEKETKALVNKIRKNMPQATLFLINDDERDELRAALRLWLAGGS